MSRIRRVGFGAEGRDLLGRLVLVAAASLLVTSPARAEQDTQDAYSRSGWFVGIGGVYAFNNFGGDSDDLDVTDAIGTLPYDPEFDNSAGAVLRGGYRFTPTLAVDLSYQFLEGYDSTVGDPALEIDSHFVVVDVKVFPVKGRYQPYLLAGGGALIMNTEIVDDSYPKPWETNVAFAAHFGTGLDLYVTEHWLVNMEATYTVPVGSLRKFPYGTFGGGFQYRF